MRFLLLSASFIICIFCIACGNQATFPDTINVTKTEKLQRVKGTRLFVSAPPQYKAMESMIRLQRDNNTYFQVLEFTNSNFNEHKSNLTKEAIERQGAKVDIVKPVKYNGYDAIYMSGPSKKEGETKLALSFGDDTFVIMLAGVCQTSDKAAIEELNTIISTSYYDKSFDLQPFELLSFTFDESITGFKYASKTGNAFVYTKNGTADLSNAENISSMFQLSTIEAPDFSKAKEFLDNTIARFSTKGQISNIKKHVVSVNGQQAYEITMDATDADNTKSKLYQIAVYSGTKAVIFFGFDDEQGGWLDKFKATAYSIKMKE